MAKRGRRSIRNKRKSVKKYSSKRRSKTRRYLRGGAGSYDDDPDPEHIAAALKKAAGMTPPNFPLLNCIAGCDSLSDTEYYKCRQACNNSYQRPRSLYRGGRRRYYKRKQSKTRKH